jgi:hypothetical protein
MEFIKGIYPIDESTSRVIENIIYDRNINPKIKQMPLNFIISLCERAKLAGVDENEYLLLASSIQEIEDNGLWKTYDLKNVYCNKEICILEYKLFKNIIQYITLREKILNEEKKNNTLKRKYNYIS